MHAVFLTCWCGCWRRARVKFWFIKNYMSPQMKRFLPRMAAHYSFDYEFVTYKWPSWLHKQVWLPLEDILYLHPHA